MLAVCCFAKRKFLFCMYLANPPMSLSVYLVFGFHKCVVGTNDEVGVCVYIYIKEKLC